MISVDFELSDVRSTLGSIKFQTNQVLLLLGERRNDHFCNRLFLGKSVIGLEKETREKDYVLEIINKKYKKKPKKKKASKKKR